ncbi:MAG: hypothetical protein IBJ12_11415 [Sphingomonadaceae bacterium]|nr:hypothetical protein [Sphingomonadaceae bacterium]
MSASVPDQQLYLQQADAALRDGRLTQAANMIAWLEENGDAVPGDDISLLKAEYAIATQDTETAAIALAAVHDADRNPCRYRMATGWLAANGDRVDEAIVAFAEASKNCPDDAGIWNLLGLAFVRKGEAAAAGEAFRRAMVLAPDEPEILNNHAVSLLQQGEAERAYIQLEKAFASSSDNDVIKGNLDFVGGMIGRTPQRRLRESDAMWSARLVNMAKGAKAASDRPRADALFSQALLTLDRFDPEVWAEIVSSKEN